MLRVVSINLTDLILIGSHRNYLNVITYYLDVKLTAKEKQICT